MNDVPKTIYDTTETQQHVLRETKRRYLNGEMTQAEYKRIVSKYKNAEAVAEEIESFKQNRYDTLSEQFATDEISEDELEQELDVLMESGDEFLQSGSKPEPVGTFQWMMNTTAEFVKESYMVILFTILVTVLALSVSNVSILLAVLPISIVAVVYLMTLYAESTHRKT